MKNFVLLLLLMKTKDDLLVEASKNKVNTKHKTYLLLKDSFQLNNNSNSSGIDAETDDLIPLNAKARSFGIYLILQI